MGPGFYELEAYAIVCVRWSRGEISKEKKKKKPTHILQKNTKPLLVRLTSGFGINYKTL